MSPQDKRILSSESIQILIFLTSPGSSQDMVILPFSFLQEVFFLPA